MRYNFFCSGFGWSVFPLMLGLTAGQVQAQVAKSCIPASEGAFYTNTYPNLLREAGYRQADIDKKVAQAYHDVFEGPNKVYFAVGDSLAYVSEVKNEDARTEGLSYGMMVAVQLNKKEVFDRFWRWSKKYLQHQGGPLEGYFAWSINPVTMKRNSEGPASDGELYFVTSFLFASNRWGNATGINYYQEARRILDASWKKDGTGNVYNLFNTRYKQLSFVPVGRCTTGPTRCTGFSGSVGRIRPGWARAVLPGLCRYVARVAASRLRRPHRPQLRLYRV
jgi:oligosaccharide reducing-end xylanase